MVEERDKVDAAVETGCMIWFFVGTGISIVALLWSWAKHWFL